MAVAAEEDSYPRQIREFESWSFRSLARSRRLDCKKEELESPALGEMGGRKDV